MPKTKPDETKPKRVRAKVPPQPDAEGRTLPTPGTKADRLREMLRKGVTIDEVVQAMGVQVHSARAKISVLNRAAKLGVTYDRATKTYKTTHSLSG